MGGIRDQWNFTLMNQSRVLFWFRTLKAAAFLSLFVWLENPIRFKQSAQDLQISHKYLVITDWFVIFSSQLVLVESGKAINLGTGGKNIVSFGVQAK